LCTVTVDVTAAGEGNSGNYKNWANRLFCYFSLFITLLT